MPLKRSVQIAEKTKGGGDNKDRIKNQQTYQRGRGG
jgi:hypothetical protein